MTDAGGRRRCPIYALRPMKIFGLDMEALSCIVVVVGIMRLLGYNGGPDLFAGFAVYYVAAFALRDKEPGYLVQWTSTLTEIPAIRRYLGGWCESMRKIWRGAGLPPPPGLQNAYDP